MPSETDLNLSEEQKQKLEEKDITEDEVGECIESEMEEGIDQDQAVAICLSKLENGSSEPTKSLENPEFEVGDFVEWEFGGGESQGEIIEMEDEVGASMSAGGNEFTIEEGDGPLYKIVEWDESEGEDGEFTNNVVKFEDALSDAERPEAAPESARSVRPRKNRDSKNVQRKNFTVKGQDVELKQENSDGDVVVNIPIQALSEDRDGDFINEKGQESIIRQLNSGKVPLVPNHGVGQGEAVYDFTDIFGQFVDGENRNGTTIGTARLREGSEMADELVDLLEQDMPVGFSVGFIPTDKEPREKDGEGMEISDLDLMEVSAVGIPSNPDAVPQAMGSAVAMAKNAGLSKQKIKSTVEKAFEDTMSEKQEQDGTDSQKTEDSKSEEQIEKQITQEDVDAMLGTIAGALDAHMDEAMQDIEEELEAMVAEEPDEEDEMDEEDEDDDKVTDEDEDEDEEEMSQDDASDHTEDEKSAESADEKSETEEVPSTVEKNQETEGKDIETFEDENESEKSETENKQSEVTDPRMLV